MHCLVVPSDVFKLETVVPRKSRSVGDRLLVDLPATWESSNIVAAPLAHRLTPFTGDGVQIHTTTRFKVPAGWAVPEQAEVKWRRDFGQGLSHAKLEDGKWIFESTLTVPSATYPATRYVDYVHEMQDWTTFLGPELSLEKTSARQAPH